MRPCRPRNPARSQRRLRLLGQPDEFAIHPLDRLGLIDVLEQLGDGSDEFTLALDGRLQERHGFRALALRIQHPRPQCDRLERLRRDLVQPLSQRAASLVSPRLSSVPM